MSDEKKMYTRDDLLRCGHDAFVDGAYWHSDHHTTRGVGEEADLRFPPPKKLREIKIGDVRYRVKDGVLQCSNHANEWRLSTYCAERVVLLADLIAHPYEEDQ